MSCWAYWVDSFLFPCLLCWLGLSRWWQDAVSRSPTTVSSSASFSQHISVCEVRLTGLDDPLPTSSLGFCSYIPPLQWNSSHWQPTPSLSLFGSDTPPPEWKSAGLLARLLLSSFPHNKRLATVVPFLIPYRLVLFLGRRGLCAVPWVQIYWLHLSDCWFMLLQRSPQ